MKNEVIEIKEEVQVGEYLLEKGDRIEVIPSKKAIKEEYEPEMSALYKAEISEIYLNYSTEDFYSEEFLGEYKEDTLDSLLNTIEYTINVDRNKWVAGDSSLEHGWGSSIAAIHENVVYLDTDIAATPEDIKNGNEDDFAIILFEIIISKIGEFPVDLTKLKGEKIEITNLDSVSGAAVDKFKKS